MMEMINRTDDTPATVGLNLCSLYLMPPKICLATRKEGMNEAKVPEDRTMDKPGRRSKSPKREPVFGVRIS